ncbi:GTP cyclohydrolase, FolE2/MptA family [Hyalangium versicolor]|uniref:GTP cyclohydrolase, FolE2/MptA family n=1 Tax=Hyalangium versicolor TaxID=2861190 RepID=UPI001CCFB7F1|nr:GTP cyclohydrolase, FolE2/MptA family [Hyalangium versicolor]
MRIHHPLEPGNETLVACNIDIRTTLDAAHRGIHVSRMGNVLTEVTQESYETLAAFAERLCRRVQQTQYGGATTVSVRSRFWYREAVSGFGTKADKQSLESVGLMSQVTSDASGHIEHLRGIEVDHITACPCVQQTLKHSLGQRKPEPVSHTPEAPPLTHSQRSRTSVEVGSASGPPIAELLQAVDEVLFRSQSTLPRPQELLLVLRAHQKPQFLEDVMRDLTRRVCQLSRELPDEAKLRIRSRSLESIHEFDLCGELVTSLAAARKALGLGADYRHGHPYRDR